MSADCARRRAAPFFGDGDSASSAGIKPVPPDTGTCATMSRHDSEHDAKNISVSNPSSLCSSSRNGFSRIDVPSTKNPKKNSVTKALTMGAIQSSFGMSVHAEDEHTTAAMRALGFTVKKAEIRQIIADIDKDENGTVEFDEFCDLMAGRISNRDTREEIMKIFRLFADEGSDFITFRNLKKVVQDLEENLNDDDMMEMIEEADRNGDGKIDSRDLTGIGCFTK